MRPDLELLRLNGRRRRQEEQRAQGPFRGASGSFGSSLLRVVKNPIGYPPRRPGASPTHGTLPYPPVDNNDPRETAAPEELPMSWYSGHVTRRSTSTRSSPRRTPARASGSCRPRSSSSASRSSTTKDTRLVLQPCQRRAVEGNARPRALEAGPHGRRPVPGLAEVRFLEAAPESRAADAGRARPQAVRAGLQAPAEDLRPDGGG